MMDSGTSAITGIHLTLIVVLAIAAVAAILWGRRLKRARAAAAAKFAADEEGAREATTREQTELGADPVQAPSVQAQIQTQSQTAPVGLAAAPPPTPVVPAPPPMADEMAPGTPPATSMLADEAIAAAAPTDARPASEAVPGRLTSGAEQTTAVSVGRGADRPVTALKGLGPKVAAALADRGITTVGQIAALDSAQADALDADLGAFRGRMTRDRWIEQARFLAADDVAGFEAVFGRL